MYRMDATTQISSSCATIKTIPDWVASGQMLHGCTSDPRGFIAIFACSNKLRHRRIIISEVAGAMLHSVRHSSLYHDRSTLPNSAPLFRLFVNSKARFGLSGGRDTLLPRSSWWAGQATIPSYSFADQTP